MAQPSSVMAVRSTRMASTLEDQHEILDQHHHYRYRYHSLGAKFLGWERGAHNIYSSQIPPM
ncbi:uncharacterized protein N7477_000628 [Penicillium maclennaniae]|uniref:uncharacterized protein n=1 Tax=Penicillium maclennaniae TaxID=1343394 RepID=UPI0025403080|nr:uncharacterized protein N7477_000628 [Penicillium maclennaniae]KAJ5684283.1 hypothetical protein N7477_000628 [Penicillium maclennaniae]